MAAAEAAEAEEEDDATVDANEAGCWRFFRACRIEGEELGDCEEDDDVRLCLRIFLVVGQLIERKSFLVKEDD